MKTPTKSLAAVAIWLAQAGAASAAPAANAVKGIEVSDQGAGVELAIQGSRAPSFTVFKLQDPPRLVVDLAGADVSAVKAPVAVKHGGVETVAVAQYKDDKAAVGRVIIGLDASAKYDVTARGEAVLVHVTPAEAEKPAEAPAPVAVAAAAEAKPQPRPEVQPKVQAQPTPEAQPEPQAAAKPASDVVASRVDEVAVKHPATALSSVQEKHGEIVLAADGQIGKVELIELVNPPRLALDLYGVKRAPKAPVTLGGAFKQARFGKGDGKVRVVLDAAAGLPRIELKRTATGLAIVPATRVARAEPAAKIEPGAQAKPEPRPAPAVKDVRFTDKGALALVEVAGKFEHEVTRPDARTRVLTLHGARLPAKLERSLDTSAFKGPVAMVSSFNQPQTGDAKIVVTLRSDAADQLRDTPAGLEWRFGAEPQKHDAGDQPVVLSDASADTAAAGFTTEAPAYAMSTAPQKRGYTGRRITLDFHDIEIKNLLRLISDVSKKNIIIADDVTGKVTVSLRNVPWDQALDLILRTKGLGKEESGNVIRVAKLADLAKEAEEREKQVEAHQKVEPLKVRLISVNFARAGDMASRVKDVLTDRGTVSVDERTNVLIVKDVVDALARAEGLVRNLDTETPQVLIESRIVEASSNFTNEIGVQWGGNASAGPGTGNPTGLVFPNIINATGGADTLSAPGVAGVPNFGVDLPAAVGQGAGGALGLVFGSAGGAFNLNLRISALENAGVVKTISAPKIATIDNREAVIGQGLSIPFSQVSAAGVNTVFVEAKLELKVTPHVTADGSILMKIAATNNAPNPQLTGANGQPSISKREAQTEVLIHDGDTTVIGGIYTRQTSNQVNEIPLLGKIPLLGYFFRHKKDTDDHTELLIFITPRILNRQAATVAQGG